MVRSLLGTPVGTLQRKPLGADF